MRTASLWRKQRSGCAVPDRRARERSRVRTVAVVPVKSLSEAKSRLSGVLTPEERTVLALDSMSHVLDALAGAPGIGSVAVISPHPEGLRLPRGVVSIVQRREALNDLLEQGREWAVMKGADALLVIFSDLPVLSSGDISRMLQLGSEPGTVV